MVKNLSGKNNLQALIINCRDLSPFSNSVYKQRSNNDYSCYNSVQNIQVHQTAIINKKAVNHIDMPAKKSQETVIDEEDVDPIETFIITAKTGASTVSYTHLTLPTN